jgi:hypothetical protein
MYWIQPGETVYITYRYLLSNYIVLGIVLDMENVNFCLLIGAKKFTTILKSGYIWIWQYNKNTELQISLIHPAV